MIFHLRYISTVNYFHTIKIDIFFFSYHLDSNQNKLDSIIDSNLIYMDSVVLL